MCIISNISTTHVVLSNLKKHSDGEYFDKTDEDSISEELEENCEEVDDMTKVKGSSSSHCHCDLFQVDDDFKVFMSNGQPYRR